MGSTKSPDAGSPATQAAEKRRFGLRRPGGSSRVEAVAPVVEPAPSASGGKNRPTPSRREAEAARMARLHPELDPKKAKQLEREARTEQRLRQTNAVEAIPERQLARDVVDSRWNVGEIALPVMLAILLIFMIPGLENVALWTAIPMYAVVIGLVIDYLLMWRKLKRLAAERIPGRSLKGVGFYAWNRQMSFRRWRQPAPRVERGQAI